MNADLPLVSIVMPTYNRSRWLQGAVDSALAQTYPNLEVLVIDDGSTDGTAEAMRGYAGRVTYLRQANRGVAAARNAGIRAAKGQYLTFLDDDDLFLPRKIERQVQLLNARPDLEFVHCRCYYVDEQGSFLHQVDLLPEGEVLPQLLRRNFVWMGGPLISRRCLERVGIFDPAVPSVTADWDLWLRIAQAGYRLGCAQEPLGAYRIHADSMMSDVAQLERGIFAVLERAFSAPNMPSDLAAQKQELYAHMHLWVSLMHYEAGQWEEGKQSLERAGTLHPQLLAEGEVFSKLLSNRAMDYRIRDPVRFVSGVLDHLPPRAEHLQRCRRQVLSEVSLRLALRSYGVGEIAQAKRQFSEALALNPALLDQTATLVKALSYHAVHLPFTPAQAYLDTVLRNLPHQVPRLRQVRARAISDANLRLARQAHRAGEPRQTVRRIRAAARHRPLSVCQRKVLSLFFRSLLGVPKGTSAERIR
jgi:GT2 family glycosyltransferase